MSIRLKLRTILRRRRVELELEEEIRYHIERQTEKNVADGMPPQEARRAAMIAFAGVEQRIEECRDWRGLNPVDNLFKDFRYALRRLARNPLFTIAAVLTIALGVGINTAVFSVYNAVALRPLPVERPGEVVRLKRWFRDGYSGDQQYRFSYDAYEYLRDHNDVFASVVASSTASPSPAAFDSGRLQVQVVSKNYFDGLGIRARIGRTFSAAAGRDSADDSVIVLSHPFWMRRFDGDPRVIGKTLSTRGRVFTIIGVAPESFSGTTLNPVVPDFWEPLFTGAAPERDFDWLNGPGDYQFNILARLKPGVSAAAAQAETDAVLRQYWQVHEEPIETGHVTAERTALFGNVDDPGFRMIAAAAMLVISLILVVACANLANVMLAHGAARQREIAIRRALGADRTRIVRQLLAEAAALAAPGAIAGLMFSAWTNRILCARILAIASPFTGGLTVRLDLSPDARVFAYALLLSVLAVFLFGLAPAIQVTSPQLSTVVKDEGGLFGSRMRRSRLRSLFITAQVAISMLFLLTAGLLMRGMTRSRNADVGFETRTVFTLSTDLGRDEARAVAFQRRIIDRLKNLPELRSVATGFAPLFGTWTPSIIVDGKTQSTLAGYASDSYFDLLDIPILRGRIFTPQEARDGSRVAVISEATARRFWPDQDPLSKRFKLDLGARGGLMEYEVIGVARDVRYANPTRLDPAHVYLATNDSNINGLLFRIQGDRETALAAVRKAVEGVDERLIPYLELRSLELPLAVHRLGARFIAYLLGSLAMLALSLAAVGIYGVTACIVGQRMKEIGVRRALGASSHAILRTVLMEGLLPVLVGVVLGISGAMCISWLLHARLVFPGSSDVLYGMPFYDPVVFGGLSCFIMAITAAAILLPTGRALRVDPMKALRHD